MELSKKKSVIKVNLGQSLFFYFIDPSSRSSIPTSMITNMIILHERNITMNKREKIPYKDEEKKLVCYLVVI